MPISDLFRSYIKTVTIRMTITYLKHSTSETYAQLVVRIARSTDCLCVTLYLVDRPALCSSCGTEACFHIIPNSFDIIPKQCGNGLDRPSHDTEAHGRFLPSSCRLIRSSESNPFQTTL